MSRDEALRESFEEWISSQDWFHATLGLGRSGGEYTDPTVNSRWQGWQAHAAEAAHPRASDFDARASFTVRTDTVTLQRNATEAAQTLPQMTDDKLAEALREVLTDINLVKCDLCKCHTWCSVEDACKTLAEHEAHTAEAAQAQAHRVVAKLLEWESSDLPEWFDKNACGFYISHEDDGSDEPYCASWGEGVSETFATLEDAKEWCQGQIDSWVRENAMLAAAPQQAAEPVGWIAVADLEELAANRAESENRFDAIEVAVSSHPFGGMNVPVYTRPQPAQDAKDAATIERVARAIYEHVFTMSIPRMGVRSATFEEVWAIPSERERLTAQACAAIDTAMAKESGR